MGNGWKTVAIVFIALFVVTNVIWCGLLYIGFTEEAKLKECYYDVCSEYPEANYVDGVCYCSEYDLTNQLVVVKTEVID